MSMGIRFQIFLKKYLSEKNYITKNVLGKGTPFSHLIHTLGSYGTIYRVVHKETKKEYAAKIIPSLNCFLKELFLSVYLNGTDPCIPSLREYFVEFNNDRNFCCLIYEFFPVDLFEFIRKKKKGIAKKKVMAIFFEILQAVKFFHANSLIFTDIAPANILINDALQIRFIDFGTICPNNYLHQNRQEFMNFEVVTYPYRPLELYFQIPYKKMTHGFPSDIWATMCSLAEFFTDGGKFLFHGENELEVVESIIKAFCNGKVELELPTNFRESNPDQIYSKISNNLTKFTLKRLLPLAANWPEMLNFFQYALVLKDRPSIDDLLEHKLFSQKNLYIPRQPKALSKDFYEKFNQVYKCMKLMRLFDLFTEFDVSSKGFQATIFKKLSLMDKALKCMKRGKIKKKLSGFYDNNSQIMELLLQKEEENMAEKEFLEKPVQKLVNETIEGIHSYFLSTINTSFE